MKYLAIGDIHGCADQLRVLLAQVDRFDQRRLAFLGDYVDIGKDSRNVLDILVQVADQRPNTIFLEGNHDAALMEYLKSGDFGRYAMLGGISTIRSYSGTVNGNVLEALRTSLPSQHVAFLEALRPFYETPDVLFSHCGYSPETPFDRSRASMVLTSHQRLFLGDAVLPKTTVCGHYFQRTRKPFITDRVICLDTGCGILGGPLTAITLPERRIIQVSANLDVSTNELPE